MADTCATYTYAGVTINGAEDSDCLVIGDNGKVLGLDGAPVRRQVDPRGNADGGLDHPAHFGPRIITFSGVVHIGTEATQKVTPEYLEKLNDLCTAVRAALEAQLNSSSTLAWTPTGQTAHSISCKYGMPGGELQFDGPEAQKTFTFQLYAADPDIAVA